MESIISQSLIRNVTDITAKINGEYRLNNQTLSKIDTIAELEIEDVNIFADICLLDHVLTFDAEEQNLKLSKKKSRL
ncbi:hypothetical protein GLOIN_2v1562854 [Rhizophagus irregularis DAOM 181602=DAOM 197198]|uniref:Uncharacterized protein n=1 Tax=Rhizophagus irregularis (strain DAOM 181602 / DAOM 197198 / MUCL 43194) TaxID=747089 RepID=A0A2P4QDH5_RHIID|nr:hypothetical protein GLOIN_2v1562854 [Rhizophagus irregularis DAOM 181602=DAOM 197198]POG75692.1 hypothetical protein GLOIN_2v1562854 [Rhizophagus irregularis DAOM 181602=DAOM 197198]|eukprot:XP_025182558.1 hypothetical protein GLOIN_2v1562854 [Rhizophagus irregularis DAOM 181602=DAOM 197198]